MKAYIALSRVRAAHDLLLTDMLPPTILSGGAHPWPTELLKVLQGSSNANLWGRQSMQEKNGKKRDVKKHEFMCFFCKEEHPVQHVLHNNMNKVDSAEWVADIEKN
eukprot:9836110-Karenia_brevis.AAC.1